MKTGPFLGVVLAATLASGLAMAQPGRGMERFGDLDTNEDGTITRAEVEARIAADFAAADLDGNGTLSQEEAVAFHQARHEDRREHRRDRDRSGRFGEHVGDDRVIDQAEFAARGMHRFEMADLDENGQVTETEMRLVASLMEGRHDRGGRHHRRHEDRHEGRHDRWED